MSLFFIETRFICLGTRGYSKVNVPYWSRRYITSNFPPKIPEFNDSQLVHGNESCIFRWLPQSDWISCATTWLLCKTTVILRYYANRLYVHQVSFHMRPKEKKLTWAQATAEILNPAPGVSWKQCNIQNEKINKVSDLNFYLKRTTNWALPYKRNQVTSELSVRVSWNCITRRS